MKTETAEKTGSIATRPPIVVVMGHIDHGKTTLLDRIRATKVAEREAGGITQAIGAYQAEHKGKKITFIDTPGHEAFSAMRARGARVADIAVLVVAADEGVKPQTEEALRNIRESELPFVVAINKIDRPNADPNRVKKELADKEVLVEGFGGTVPVAELSAKSGEGVETLLETILLLAELEELKSDASKCGQGVVIESHLDPRRGAAATLLLEDGVVKRGDYLVIGDQSTPVRIFENFLGQPIDEAHAAEPIRITGFSRIPELGEKFTVCRTRGEAEVARSHAASAGLRPTAANEKTRESGKHIVNIILKTDMLGSKEALEDTLAKVGSAELANRILKSEVGDVTESDVKLASASKNTIVVGFNVKVPPSIQELAERNEVMIVSKNIIYELIDAVKAAMIERAPAETRRVDLGRAKILALFKEEPGKQIVGGRVETGRIEASARFDIIRNQVKIGGGRVAGLQSQRRDTDAVPEGQEFGLKADVSIPLAVGDNIDIFGEEKLIHRL
ncbi:MAG: translation initiation factor IF-2 [Candidatus Sungbacteria bacterium]|uniref:Translation initiation factor IF-2 n=1 Tax=Candidatus Sungiibacteriota bacterium TaxID=2750080 RepID=A0A933DUA1_9BACT|nr:translation initiation factor IF-2 [Candidatus Sungbacteria bacterium]